MEKTGDITVKKRKVLFVDESGGAWPWSRQMQEVGNSWGQTDYSFGPDCTGGYDWLVVYSAWPDMPLVTSVPLHRRIFVAGEPESFHRYQPRFLEQFGTVITTQSNTKHPGAILMQPGINWFAGVKFVDGIERFRAELDFSSLEIQSPVKTKLCSVICSNNAVTSGHRQRIKFVEQLKEEFGDQIDYFGRGSRTMADKDEALAEYRFHIALENSIHHNYWTEKLADPFLRDCFPIYSGCTNVAEYFPKGSYVRIDIDRPREAFKIIQEVLRSDFDQKSMEVRREAKRRVMYEYNIFSELEKLYPTLELSEDTRMLDNSCPQTRLYSDHEAKDFKLSRRFRHWARGCFGASSR
jgi:hypothetical protein